MYQILSLLERNSKNLRNKDLERFSVLIENDSLVKKMVYCDGTVRITERTWKKFEVNNEKSD